MKQFWKRRLAAGAAALFCALAQITPSVSIQAQTAPMAETGDASQDVLVLSPVKNGYTQGNMGTSTASSMASTNGMLRIKYSNANSDTSDTYKRRTYIEFDLSSVDALQLQDEAVLTFTIKSVDSGYSNSMPYYVGSIDQDIDTLTWERYGTWQAPADATPFTLSSAAAEAVTSVDVKAQVQSALEASKSSITLCLYIPTSAQNNGINVYNKDDASGRGPKLTITRHETPADVQTSVSLPEIFTPAGTIPQLPSSVEVSQSLGAQTTKTMASVVWNRTLGAEDVATAGSFVLEGSCPDYEGLDVSLSVTVLPALESGSTTALPVRIFEPEDETLENVPLVLFLHGAGERGNDGYAHINSVFEDMMSNQPEFANALIVAPQCPEDQRWVETDWTQGNYDMDEASAVLLDEVMQIVEEVSSRCSIDTDRVYVMGLSMGGIATWNLLARYSDVFAAGIPVCGAADVSKADIFTDIPVWTFHGTADDVVPYAGTQAMVEAISQAGGRRVELTTVQDAGHNVWNTAFAKTDLDNWLFSKRLSDRTNLLNVFDESNTDCWADSVSKAGVKTASSSMLASHKILVQEDDVLTWSRPASLSSGVDAADLFDEDGHWISSISLAQCQSIADGQALSYTVTGLDANDSDCFAGYVRINMPSNEVENFMVFRNLNTDWPQEFVGWVNPLNERTLIGNGDSIAFGAYESSEYISNLNNEDLAYAWVGRIGDANDMSWQNVSKRGTTVSTVRAATFGSIPERFDNQDRAQHSFDYVLLQGGTNDGTQCVPLGSITEGVFDKSAFDRTTWAGALEYYFAKTIEKYPGARIGYIFTYAQPKCTYSKDDNSGQSNIQDMSDYYAMAAAICRKWNIPYLNLHDGTTEVNGELVSYSSDLLKTTLRDNAGGYLDQYYCHINSDGYNVITPYIEQWTAALPIYEPVWTEAAPVKETLLVASADTYVQGGADASKTGNDLMTGSMADRLRVKTTDGTNHAYSRKTAIEFDLTRLEENADRYELRLQTYGDASCPGQNFTDLDIYVIDDQDNLRSSLTWNTLTTLLLGKTAVKSLTTANCTSGPVINGYETKLASVDITDAVNQALAAGKTKLTLALSINKTNQSNNLFDIYSVSTTRTDVLKPSIAAVELPYVTSVDRILVSTTIGTLPTLPETVPVHVKTGDVEEMDALWDAVDISQVQSAGVITVSGTLKDYPDVVIEARVTIEPADDYEGTAYYVSNTSGQDSNSGLSPESPWKTLDKLNSVTFLPGDTIYMEAGSVWTGSLKPLGSGKEGKPITLTSYGDIEAKGRPRIDGNGTSDTYFSAALMLRNQGWWTISNLELTNKADDEEYGQACTKIVRRAGMYIFTSDQEEVKKGIDISNCYVHDVISNTSNQNALENCKMTGGIILWARAADENNVALEGVSTNLAGFEDVSIHDNIVQKVCHEGIRTAAPSQTLKNISISSNRLEDILGDGIVLSQTLNSRAEGNKVNRAAGLNLNGGYYAGVWAYYSDNCQFRYNEVANTVYGMSDGQAFDADTGCTNTLFEYNYSHDNQGGTLLMMPQQTNTVFRYNISVNDALGSGQEIIQDHSNNGTANGAPMIYNNTFYTAKNDTYLFSSRNTAGSAEYVTFVNNVLAAPEGITGTRFCKSNVGIASGSVIEGNLIAFDGLFGISSASYPDNQFAKASLTNPQAYLDHEPTLDDTTSFSDKVAAYALSDSSQTVGKGKQVAGQTMPAVDMLGASIDAANPGVGALVYTGEVTPPAEQLDYTLLDLVLDATKSLDASAYSSSLSALQSQRASSEDVRKNAEAQSQIDESARALNQLWMQLRLIPNTSALDTIK